MLSGVALVAASLLMGLLGGIALSWFALPRLGQAKSGRVQAAAEAQHLFAAAMDAVVVVDAEGKIQSANPAAGRLFAMASGALIGRRLEDFLHGIKGSPAAWSSRGGKKLKHDGERMVELSVSAISASEAGEYAVTLHDITERKRYEAQLSSKANELEQKNEEAERVAEALQQANQKLETANTDLQKKNEEIKSTQIQLMQAEKMASIGQLAAGVAHEINNPVGYVKSNLGTLKGYADDLVRLLESHEPLIKAVENQDLLAANVAAQQVRALAKDIDAQFIIGDLSTLTAESQEGIERVRQIVQGLKDFSRVDQQEEQPFNVNECLESTLKIVWNEMKYKADVIKELGQVPDVYGFPHQLNQVFMNLMVNAAQAMQARGNIWLRSFVQGDWVVVEIEDDGSGIPEAILSKIFDPFFTTKPVGEGTGLGLSISYGIVQSHKGKLEVESQMDVGTKFRIYLPLSA